VEENKDIAISNNYRAIVRKTGKIIAFYARHRLS
jgi:hypothetical protein